MSWINCNIIADLLELYSDGVVSEDTNSLVTEHLHECVKCNERLKQIEQTLSIPTELNIEPIKHIRRRIRRRNILVALISFLIIAPTVLLLMGTFAQSKGAVPYEETHIISVEEGRGDWELYIFFADNIDEYAVTQKHVDEETMEVYFYFTKSNYAQYVSPINPADSFISIPAYEEMRESQSEEPIKRQTVRIYYCTFGGENGRMDFGDRHLVWEK